MKRITLAVVAVAAMIGVAAFTTQQNEDLRLNHWASKAADEPETVAVLLEFGTLDNKTTDWSGHAKVDGAKVVHREGYRFRNGDELTDNGWKAKSHTAIRGSNNIIIKKLEGISTVGIVYHLQHIKDNAVITVSANNRNDVAKVNLGDVLAGKTVKMFGGYAVARLVTAATPVATGPTEDDYPAAAYGPDGTLWVAYVSYRLRVPSRRIEQGRYEKQPENFKDLYRPEPADQVFVKYYSDGKWSDPIAVTGPKEDVARVAVGVTGDNVVSVVYSTRRNGNFDLYERSLSGKVQGQPSLDKEQRLTNDPGSDATPAMCTDSNGNLWLACQSWDEEGAGIRLLQKKNGKWGQAVRISGKSGENCWHPVLAAGPNEQVALAYDRYHQGDYDIFVHVQTLGKGFDAMHIVAATAKSETRPAIAFRGSQLWIAYEEGPEDWGKDYGALDSKAGNPLYNARSTDVVYLDTKTGNLHKPTAKLPKGIHEPPQLPFNAIKTNQFERAPKYAYPKIGVDLSGRVWLTYRRNFGSRYSSHPGAIWMTYARCLQGDHWGPEIEVNHSDGLLDSRPVMLPHKNGGMLIVHNTDGRFTTPNTINNRIFASVVSSPGKSSEPELVKHTSGKAAQAPEVEAERKAVADIRKYRIKNAGKSYQILRGEYHRHTEISWDGAPDGSLEDMFRYAIDAAAFDWIGNGDHDNGAGREYPWWLTQKYTDAYHVANHFTPMFTYERSVSYPHGHRNVMFAKRGVMTLPRLAAPKGVKKVAGISPDDTKMLYRYLKEMDGICAVHSSATGMGTDWRDNDPKVEPIVEIYQGDRMSYEHPGAPRAGYDPQTNKFPANVGGWRPLGFVNLPLTKGYRLGFQASSDHWSTHISYFMVLAEKHDRDAILDAVKKRHVYGATDNIILDVTSNDYMMGDEFKTRKAPSLSIKVIGTAPLAKIDIMKDSEPVATFKGKGKEFEKNWTDPRPTPGVNYYYVRVLQRDNEIAWGSPMWIEYVE